MEDFGVSAETSHAEMPVGLQQAADFVFVPLTLAGLLIGRGLVGGHARRGFVKLLDFKGRAVNPRW